MTTVEMTQGEIPVLTGKFLLDSTGTEDALELCEMGNEEPGTTQDG